MRHISIRTLMGFVLAIAVAFTALRGANDYWAGAFHTLTLGLIGYAILAAIRGNKPWLGFLVACGGYFLAMRILPTAEVDLLPTSRVLKYIQARVSVEFTVTTTTFKRTTKSSQSVIVSTGTIDADGNEIQFMNRPTKLSAIDWSSLIPGAANLAYFRLIGHDLFALTFGWFGSLAARRMWAQYPPSGDESPRREA